MAGIPILTAAVLLISISLSYQTTKERGHPTNNDPHSSQKTNPPKELGYIWSSVDKDKDGVPDVPSIPLMSEDSMESSEVAMKMIDEYPPLPHRNKRQSEAVATLQEDELMDGSGFAIRMTDEDLSHSHRNKRQSGAASILQEDELMDGSGFAIRMTDEEQPRSHRNKRESEAASVLQEDELMDGSGFALRMADEDQPRSHRTKRHPKVADVESSLKNRTVNGHKEERGDPGLRVPIATPRTPGSIEASHNKHKAPIPGSSGTVGQPGLTSAPLAKLIFNATASNPEIISHTMTYTNIYPHNAGLRSTGVFTASQPGIYFFSVEADFIGISSQVTIFKNRVVASTQSVSTLSPKLSLSTFTYLGPKDQVYCTSVGLGSFSDIKFVGYLIARFA